MKNKNRKMEEEIEKLQGTKRRNKWNTTNIFCGYYYDIIVKK